MLSPAPRTVVPGLTRATICSTACAELEGQSAPTGSQPVSQPLDPWRDGTVGVPSGAVGELSTAWVSQANSSGAPP